MPPLQMYTMSLTTSSEIGSILTFLRPQLTRNFKSYHLLEEVFLDFPGGAVVKNPPASAADTGSSPGPGGSHMPRSN